MDTMVEPSIIVSLDNICRLCMSVSLVEMEPIFKSLLGRCLATKISSVTQLKPSEGDGLPANVCQQCVFKLDIAATFIQKSVLSDKAIRAAMQASQNARRAPMRNEEYGNNRQLVENQSVDQTAVDVHRATSPLRCGLKKEPSQGGNDKHAETPIETYIMLEDSDESNSLAADDGSDIPTNSRHSNRTVGNTNVITNLLKNLGTESDTSSVCRNKSDPAVQTNATALESMTENNNVIVSAKDSCRTCDKTCDTSLDPRNYSLGQVEKRPTLTCDSCTCTSKNTRFNDVHLHKQSRYSRKRIPGWRTYKCDSCKKTFNLRNTFLEHIVLIHKFFSR